MSNTSSPPLSLIGDIGGTNARFAVIAAGSSTPEHTAILSCCDYPTIADCIHSFLARIAPTLHPKQAALAVAAPVTGDCVALTNLSWRFSIAALRDRLGWHQLRVVNDFTANALAIPLLADGDRRQIGDGQAEPDAPIAVIGPGSGLGVSGLLPNGAGWLPLSGEGGHVTLAPATDREAALLSRLRQSGHVSAERVISGPGLVALYQALCALEGDIPAPLSAAEITANGLAQLCPRCAETIDLFAAFLGTVAGNLALTLGARGGVYLAGGIAPRLGLSLDRSAFRRRFAEKGEHAAAYLAPIPTYLITHPTPAFLGLRALLEPGHSP